MTTKKAIGKVHLWLGLSSGLVVCLLGLTGCILAFEYEIKDIIYKDRYKVEYRNQAPLPVAVLLPIAQKALGENHPIGDINIPQEPGKTAFFSSSKSNPDGWNYFNSLEYYYTAFLNPYTGELVKIENSKMEFFRLVVEFHYAFFLERIGKQIVGWSTAIFIIMLISGLILWWPKNKAAAKQRFRFRWKNSTRWKRKNYDLHNIPGFYSLVFALIIALTGLVWAFPSFDNGMQWLVNGGKTIPEEESFSDTAYIPQKKESIFDKILADMKSRSGGDTYYIGIPEEKNCIIYGYSEFKSNSYKWVAYHYDQYTGENLYIRRFEDKPPGEQLRNMNYHLHTGAILGLPGQILAFIISAVCMFLPVTGFFIWLGRRKKKQSLQ